MKIHANSHLDHGLTPAHLTWLAAQIGDRTEPFAETFALLPELPSLTNALYGPAAGDAPVVEDEVFYGRRGDRCYRSRLVRRPLRETRLVTVVGGPYDGDPCVLFTAYGGPAAPPELWSLGVERADVPAIESFWRDHAIAAP